MREREATIEFICRPLPGNLITHIEAQGFKVQQLPAIGELAAPKGNVWIGYSEEEDAAATEDLLAQSCIAADLLIVDHYGLGSLYTRSLRHYFKHQMVIDDLANRAQDCDTLLDQNLLPDYRQRYNDIINHECTCLLGPQYALLREEFYQYQPLPERQRLLVFFGGSDPWQLTLQTLEALQQLNTKCPPVDIVVGAQHSDQQLIAEMVQQLPDAQLHIQTQQMAKLMSEAKLMLGAGGSTHWERCLMGLPGLIVTVAENQRATTEYLAQKEACIWLGEAGEITVKQLRQSLKQLFTDQDQLDHMSRQAQQLVPRSGGTQSVVQHLMSQREVGIA